MACSSQAVMKELTRSPVFFEPQPPMVPGVDLKLSSTGRAFLEFKGGLEIGHLSFKRELVAGSNGVLLGQFFRLNLKLLEPELCIL